MVEEQKGVEAPKEKDTQELPMTADEFRDALTLLFERAKAAGVRPLQVMAESYVKKSLGIVDRVLAALEEDYDEKKKK